MMLPRDHLILAVRNYIDKLRRTMSVFCLNLTLIAVIIKCT